MEPQSAQERFDLAKKAYAKKSYDDCMVLCLGLEADISSQQSLRILVMHLEGDVLLDTKKYEKAVELYDRLLALEGGDIAHANRGFALMELARWSEAYRSYENAIALNPENMIAAKFACECLVEMDRPQDALQLVNNFIAQYADNGGLYRAKGLACLELGIFDEAYSAFHRATKLDENDQFSRKVLIKLEQAAYEKNDADPKLG